MLPKKIRLTTSLFDQVFKNGKVQHSERFWMRSFLLPIKSPCRFAVAVSKKIAPTAVLRNGTKRVVYRAIEMFGNGVLTDKQSFMIIFGVKKDLSKVPFEEILKELKGLVLKLR